MLDRIIMAGSGGQGIQFAGQLLTLAAIDQGLKATYVPSYGAERRGGKSFCTVVVGDHEIYAPVFQEVDILLALDQRARNEYSHQVKDSGLIIADQDLAAISGDREVGKVLLVPAHAIAAQLRKEVSAQNLVMLGVYLGLGHGVSLASALKVLELKSGKKPHLLATNAKALETGHELAAGLVK